MERVKSFSAPHKALRNVISKFSYSLGNTDFTNPDQLIALKELGNEVFTLLNDHAGIENDHLLAALEERVEGASHHDRGDHERLEKIQDALEHRLKDFTGSEPDAVIHAYYIDFSRFHAQYLEHIFEEETVTEKLLQQNFTDEELMQMRATIMQKVPFPTFLKWVKYMIPSQREAENAGMLIGFMANAPKEATDKVLEVIKNELEPARYNSLMAKLGVSQSS